MEKELKKFLKTLKLNENTISMALGALVVIVTGILIVNYFKDKDGNTLPDLSTTIENASEHIVKEGETLWSIAEGRYGSGYNWVDIYEANKLTSESIEVGQKLNLPDVSTKQPTDTKIAEAATPAPEATPATEQTPEQKPEPSTAPTTDSYTVAKGDSLWKIAVNAYGDGYKWVEIAKANNLDNPDVIHPGNVLTLPR